MKSYLITDPGVYGSDAKSLRHSLETAFSKYSVEYALFRDKTTDQYAVLAEVFVETSRKHKIPTILLHGDIALSKRLHADGVHLTGTQFELINDAKKMGLYVVVSTHTHEEALQAEALGADAITYSPVFSSPGKGEPKGLEDLKEIVDKINIPIFALGGIVTQEQIDAVENCGAYGFASIRHFIEN